MIVRRITIVLPPRMRATALHDGRAIGEAVALALHARAGDAAAAAAAPVCLDGSGLSGPALARLAASALARGGRHGG